MDVFLIIITLLLLALAYWLFRKKMLGPVLIYLVVIVVIGYIGNMLKEVFEEVFLLAIFIILLVLAYWYFRKKMIGHMLNCLGVACGGIAAYMDMELTAVLLFTVANGVLLYTLYNVALNRLTQQPFILPLLFPWFISLFVLLSYELPSHLRLLYGAGKPTPITIVFISILILTFLTLAYKSFRKKMEISMLIFLGVASAFLAASMGMKSTALLLFGVINMGIVVHAFKVAEKFKDGYRLGDEWKLILLAWSLSLLGMWDIGSCRPSCKSAPWPGEFISILIPSLLFLGYWSSRKKMESLSVGCFTLACAFVVVGIVDSSFLSIWQWYIDYPYLNLLTIIFLLMLFGASATSLFMTNKKERRQYRFPWNLISIFVVFFSLFGFVVYLSYWLMPWSWWQ